MKMNHAGAALVLSAALVLEGCSVGGAGSASSTIFTGSVSANVHLTDITVIVTDSSTPAKTFTTPVLADGSYSVDTEGGGAPFLFHAHGRGGSRTVDFFSASAASSGKVNISPLTTLVVASAAGHDCAVVACTPSSFTAARLTSAATEVQTRMVPLLTQFGLAIADTLDAKQGDPARTRKWVFFKHVAAGGYVYSRDGPLEFIKDVATGNWRMTGDPQGKSGAKSGKDASLYTPPAGASSYGKWLPFSAESSAYPDGATLIVVSGSSISPPVNLVYAVGDNGTAKLTGAEMVGAVAGVSFLPACPRAAGKTGSCIDITQITDGGEYSASFVGSSAALHSRATSNTEGYGF